MEVDGRDDWTIRIGVVFETLKPEFLSVMHHFTTDFILFLLQFLCVSSFFLNFGIKIDGSRLNQVLKF